MKKLVTAIFCLILVTNLIFGQTTECITCKGNTINPDKVSSAIGEKNTSNAMASFAGGRLSEAIGDYSFAFGNMAKANALSAIAIGAENQSLGMYSVAIGRGSICNGGASMALGYMNVAQVESSYLFGKFLKSTSNGNVTIGMGAGTGSNYLVNNQAHSLMVGFNSIYPTLYVNSGAGVDKTGKVGIGNITAPTAKLHIKADDNEHASLKLEPTGAGKLAMVTLGNNGHELSALANGDLKFKTQNGKGFFFENGKVVTSGLQLSSGSGAGKLLQSDIAGNAIWTDPAWVIQNDNIHRLNGNVGIGTTNPVQKLDINGTLKATGFIIATGAGLGKVLTSDASGNAAWQVTPEDGHWFTSGDNIYRINGNVGIGTQSPQAMLHVNGDLKLLSDNPTYQFQILSNGQVPARRGISLTDDPDGAFNFYIHGWQTDAAFNFINGQNNNYLMKIAHNGNVGIGTTNTSEAKLTVAGKIHAKEIKVTIDAGGGADFVFDDDHIMPSLQELEVFIKLNRHLPGIQSAKMMENDGVNLGEMQMILLQKIEELTLYAIEQDNKIALLNDQLNNLLRRIQDEDN
jgi:hypothetical protein